MSVTANSVKETKSAKENALAGAEFERRGLRKILYVVTLLGLIGTFLPEGTTAGSIVFAVCSAGLAASPRPIAA